MPTYHLTGFSGLRQVETQLTEDRYLRVRDARSHLFDALGIEEKYGFVLQNYLEFQEDLLRAALRVLGFATHEWDESISAIQLFNRRIFNLLSTCRLYIDQVRHDLSSIYGKPSPARDLFDQSIEAAKSEWLGFRALEQLRNYVQHRSLPTHQIVRGSRLVSDQSGRKCSYTQVFLEVSRLKDDPKFSQVVYRELEALGEHVDLNMLIAQYMTGLSRIHATLRDHMKTDVARWESEIEASLADIAILGEDGRVVGGRAETRLEDGTATDAFALFIDFVERRRNLRNQHRAPVNYVNRLVTSEPV